MASATWSFPCLDDSTVAEALVVRLGMQFADELMFHNLLVESDSLNVITGLKNSNFPHSYLGALLIDCHALSNKFLNISFFHVGRFGNHAAHCLAKFALHNPDQI